MDKKGFTLIELISVIIILSLLAVVVFPMILSSVTKSKNDLESDNEKMAIAGAKRYVTDNMNDFKSYEGNTYCIKIITLYDGGYINKSSDMNINNQDKVQVKYHSNKFEYSYIKNNQCNLAGSGQEY